MSANICNAYNKDSFYSVRQKAWHGLGTIVENYQTSSEVIVGAGLDYTVEKRPKKAMDNFGDFTLEMPGCYATVRTDNQSVLGEVKEKFTIIQNIDAFKFFDDIVKGEGIKYETAGALGNGETIFVSAKLPSYIKIGNNDICEQYLFLTNSHDGTKAVTMGFTPIRIVCNNTLMASLRGCQNKYKIYHTENAQLAMQEAAKFMGITNTLSGLLENAFNVFAKVRIDDVQLKKLVMLAMAPTDLKAEDIVTGNIEKASTYFTNVVDRIMTYNYEAPSQQLETTKGTVFGAMNAVTGYFQNVMSFENKSQKRSAADRQLDAMLFGNTATKTQKMFELCADASKSTMFLN